MTLLSVLDRFRPAGAPGSAGAMGVPALEDAGPAAELAPVLVALAPALDAARRRAAEASRTAAAEVERAREQAEALVAQARLAADAARSTAAAEVRAQAVDADERVLREAQDEARRLAATGRARIDDLVPRLTAAVLRDPLGEEP